MYDPVTGMPLSAEGTGGSDLGFLERIGFFNPENRRALEKAERAAAQKQTAIPYNQATMPAKDYTRTDPRATSANTFEDSVKAVSAAPTADTGRKGPSAGPTAGPVAGPRAPAQAGLGDLATTYADILKKQDYKDPAEARLKALEKLERTAAEDAKAALLRDQAKFEDAYKGREKRLSDRELDIGKQKDTNTGLAFLNAGLAIMSTPGGLATAIGKGAQVGTAQFAAGLDKIRSAQERLDEARDKMEDLKLNRAEMSAKDIRAAEKDIRNVGVDAEKRAIDGIRTAADVNRKTATDLFKATVDVGVGRERIESTEKIATLDRNAANARAGAPSAEMREAMLLGTGSTDAERYLSGLKVKQALLGDKQGTQLFKMFLEENGRREKNMEKPLTLEQFRSQSAAFFAPPAAVDTSAPTRP
jgi:hypothetical protein